MLEPCLEEWGGQNGGNNRLEWKRWRSWHLTLSIGGPADSSLQRHNGVRTNKTTNTDRTSVFFPSVSFICPLFFPFNPPPLPFPLSGPTSCTSAPSYHRRPPGTSWWASRWRCSSPHSPRGHPEGRWPSASGCSCPHGPRRWQRSQCRRPAHAAPHPSRCPGDGRRWRLWQPVRRNGRISLQKKKKQPHNRGGRRSACLYVYKCVTGLADVGRFDTSALALTEGNVQGELDGQTSHRSSGQGLDLGHGFNQSGFSAVRLQRHLRWSNITVGDIKQ